jgi:putative CocE/NonD family hydrolase
MKLRTLAVGSLLLLLATPFFAAENYPVKVERGVSVRMRDGVILRGDIFRPDAEGKFPILLQRTLTAAPLGAMTWILPSEPHREGYIVFLQDVRGRYTSDGEWYPFLHESEDGYDTIEWIAARPYSDGRVGILPSSREHMLNHVFRQLHRTCAVQVHHVQFGI